MDDSQTDIPRSFVELYLAPGALKPREPRALIAARYELCEDLAQMLTETALAKRFELGVTELDVLERMQAGLRADAGLLSADEAWWVVRRLAELLAWPAPPAAD